MKIPTAGMTLAGPSGDQTLRLEKPLGGGAFGVVFVATDTTNGTPYAVKFPQSAVFGGDRELAAFLNEIQASVHVRHENVVRVVYVGGTSSDSDDLPYIVMEFVAGGTLKSRLDQCRAAGVQVEAEQVFLWSRDLIEGIAAVNAVMLHRDLKPDNILVDDERLKIADFGLSKLVGAATRTMTFKGGQHVCYMAPEGWQGETNAKQIDMYAMGIVLFELASLQFPYQLPSNPPDVGEACRQMHLFQHPKSLKSLRPDLPPIFHQMISKLMAKRAAERYRDWAEVAAALEQCRQSSEQGGASGSPRSATLSAILNATQEIHETAQRRQSEAERQQAEALERQQIDGYQRDALLEDLREVVDEFNRASQHGKITGDWISQTDSVITSRARGSYEFSVPVVGRMRMGFFAVDPPMNLKVGKARYMGYVREPHGGGFNFLLCRKSDADIYGEWKVCHVTVSAFMSTPGKWHEGAQPFGFDTPEDAREIERGDRAMQVYEPRFEDDVQGAFLRLIHGAIELQRQVAQQKTNSISRQQHRY